MPMASMPSRGSKWSRRSSPRAANPASRSARRPSSSASSKTRECCEMATLLVAEHDNKTLKDATNKALTAAKALGGDVHILVAGAGCKAVADAAAKLDGVKKVLLADAPVYQHWLGEPLAALVVSLAGGYDAIVAAATTTGKNFMPRVAALLDVMQVSDISKVVAPDTFERPIYAGNAIQPVK